VAEPESSAVRVALWRALHAEVDPPPHVLEDEVGLELVAPDQGWRSRPDMHPEGTRPFRVAIVARARFVEDLVAEQAGKGVGQYVLLGAGLDTFAQRRRDLAARLRLFEIDQPGPQSWKRERLMTLGYGIPEWLRFVPVDFEAGASWWDELIAAGFDPARRAVVACTGVSMYLTKDATTEMLRHIAALAAGSMLAMTFMVPFDMLDDDDRAGVQIAAEGAQSAGTPWISFYRPDEILALAHQAGFREASHVTAKEVADRYFEGRIQGLRSSSGEDFLLAQT
jgi:methyltransferase (TIGR00027 family)